MPRTGTPRTAVAPRTAAAKGPVPPSVIDRGIDVAAVARSLLEYGRWIKWYDPDPALVARAYQPGSPPELITSKYVRELRRIGAHIVEVDRAPFEFEIISLLPNVVSFRLTEHLAHRELISASGKVLERDPQRSEQYVISMMRASVGEPWRLNLVELRNRRIEVQL